MTAFARLLSMFAAVCAIGISHPALAAVVLVTSEGGIQADGTINWGSLGGPSTIVNQPFNIAVTGIGGLLADVSMPSGPFQRLNQNSGWFGNFGAGEQLLFTNFNSGPLRIEFSDLVGGVGAQIQRNAFGAFTATIEAFDANDLSLGLFNLAGNSTGAGDDSAIFIGILSDFADITAIEFNVSGGANFAINAPRIEQGVPAPEPASLAIWGLVGLGAVAYRHKRRKMVA